MYDTRGRHFPRIESQFKADCNVPDGDYSFPMTIYWKEYVYSDSIEYYSATNSHINPYAGTSFTLTPINPVIQGLKDTVSWDVQVCNETASLDVDYGYFIVKDSTFGLSIDHIVDISEEKEVPIEIFNMGGGNTLVQIGKVEGAACKTIRIYSLYKTCTNEVLDIDLSLIHI